AGRTEIVHRLAGLGHRVEQLLGVWSKRPARRGQSEAALAADEQRNTERLLESADPGADGGLGHPQRIGGPPEAPERAHREKGFALPDLHPFTSLIGVCLPIWSDYTHL